MKRTLIALITALTLLLAGVTIRHTVALLGGTFEVTGTAATEDFGVTLESVSTADQALQPGIASQTLSWRIRNAGTLPADIGVRFEAPSDAQGYAVALEEVHVVMTVTAEIYGSPQVASYSGPLSAVADHMLVASRSLPKTEVWRIDVSFILPSATNPALSDGVALPWALDFTARQTAQDTSDLRSNTTSTVPTLGWLH